VVEQISEYRAVPSLGKFGLESVNVESFDACLPLVPSSQKLYKRVGMVGKEIDYLAKRVRVGVVLLGGVCNSSSSTHLLVEAFVQIISVFVVNFADLGFIYPSQLACGATFDESLHEMCKPLSRPTSAFNALTSSFNEDRSESMILLAKKGMEMGGVSSLKRFLKERG
jgi:hypothetical protein